MNGTTWDELRQTQNSGWIKYKTNPQDTVMQDFPNDLCIDVYIPWASFVAGEWGYVELSTKYTLGQ